MSESFKVYPITPVPKPRMTRRDRWAKRPCVMRYWAFKDAVRLHGMVIPPKCCIVFVLPMPASWSVAKREEMTMRPHTVKPDIDNLLKACLDAVHDSDAHIHTVRASKVWGGVGEIRIAEIA